MPRRGAPARPARPACWVIAAAAGEAAARPPGRQARPALARGRRVAPEHTGMRAAPRAASPGTSPPPSSPPFRRHNGPGAAGAGETRGDHMKRRGTDTSASPFSPQPPPFIEVTPHPSPPTSALDQIKGMGSLGNGVEAESVLRSPGTSDYFITRNETLNSSLIPGNSPTSRHGELADRTGGRPACVRRAGRAGRPGASQVPRWGAGGMAGGLFAPWGSGQDPGRSLWPRSLPSSLGSALSTTRQSPALSCVGPDQPVFSVLARGMLTSVGSDGSDRTLIMFNARVLVVNFTPLIYLHLKVL